MTTLKYIFRSNCISVSKIFGPYTYRLHNIHCLNYRVIEVPKGWRLEAHCYIQIRNNISQCSYKIKIDTYSRFNLSLRGLSINQGYLARDNEKNIKEGLLQFRRIEWFCPRYLPRSVSVFVTHNKHSTFNCSINIRVIMSDFNKEAIHAINLHCLDTARVIRRGLYE